VEPGRLEALFRVVGLRAPAGKDHFCPGARRIVRATEQPTTNNEKGKGGKGAALHPRTLGTHSCGPETRVRRLAQRRELFLAKLGFAVEKCARIDYG
jgi:hypothetical protein